VKSVLVRLHFLNLEGMVLSGTRDFNPCPQGVYGGRVPDF